MRIFQIDMKHTQTVMNNLVQLLKILFFHIKTLNNKLEHFMVVDVVAFTIHTNQHTNTQQTDK